MLWHGMSSAYSKFYGQCSNVIRLKLAAVPAFAVVKKNSNLLGLLELLEGVILDFKGGRQPVSFPVQHEQEDGSLPSRPELDSGQVQREIQSHSAHCQEV